MSYNIFKCGSCDRLNMSKYGTKNKICAFCGKKNNLKKNQIIAQASTSRNAREIISKLKSQTLKKYYK